MPDLVPPEGGLVSVSDARAAVLLARGWTLAPTPQEAPRKPARKPSRTARILPVDPPAEPPAE